MSIPIPNIPCKWCGTPTSSMLSTKMCDGCWELETRIKSSPKLARLMLASLEEAQPRAILPIAKHRV